MGWRQLAVTHPPGTGIFIGLVGGALMWAGAN
jgi:hypothetical protein